MAKDVKAEALEQAVWTVIEGFLRQPEVVLEQLRQRLAAERRDTERTRAQMSGLHQIGRITTAGAITGYPVGEGVGPWGITAAPDGSLWFTEWGAGYIGQITTAGVITEYKLPSDEEAASSSLRILTASPADGTDQTSLTFTGGGFAPNETVRNIRQRRGLLGAGQRYRECQPLVHRHGESAVIAVCPPGCFWVRLRAAEN